MINRLLQQKPVAFLLASSRDSWRWAGQAPGFWLALQAWTARSTACSSRSSGASRRCAKPHRDSSVSYPLVLIYVPLSFYPKIKFGRSYLLLRMHLLSHRIRWMRTLSSSQSRGRWGSALILFLRRCWRRQRAFVLSLFRAGFQHRRSSYSRPNQSFSFNIIIMREFQTNCDKNMLK